VRQDRCVDEDFGPFFLKFCSYFPYTAKLCINGPTSSRRPTSQPRWRDSSHYLALAFVLFGVAVLLVCILPWFPRTKK
jgi:hypothetical protein